MKVEFEKTEKKMFYIISAIILAVFSFFTMYITAGDYTINKIFGNKIYASLILTLMVSFWLSTVYIIVLWTQKKVLDLTPKKHEEDFSYTTCDPENDDVYFFKVKDYTTLLVGRQNRKKRFFYVQRGDGTIQRYDEDRIIYSKKILDYDIFEAGFKAYRHNIAESTHDYDDTAKSTCLKEYQKYINEITLKK